MDATGLSTVGDGASAAADLAARAAEVATEAASGAVHGGGDNLVHRMMILIIQVAVIIFAVRVGGGVMKRLKMPSVLGELLVGIVIGPYMLGGISLNWLGFPHGVFPMADGFPVSPELYGFSILASIILLFVAGLETDLRQFLKYSVAGTVIGIGGVVVSFAAGDMAAVFWAPQAGLTFLSPACLFLGALCTATSVGITARILSEKKKMDSPEGVTILAAAIIDDVLGIIALAIIISLIDVLAAGHGDALPWGQIGGIALKTVSICVVFSALGLVFANPISRFLKSFKEPTVFTTLALGMACLVAGIFESAGLAMIIGAYVMGLSLSKTDITFVVQERIHGLYEFFVPLFFAVMGMMVDVNRLVDPRVLKFGLIFAVLAVLAKVVGCALPALFLRFNAKGALRIGAGMVPRGEVALIISGIGMSAGILDADMFGAAIIMTLVTTMVAPPILSLALALPGPGITRETGADDYRRVEFPFSSAVVADAASDNILNAFHDEGFFASMMDASTRLYHLRKDDSAISMWRDGNKILFSTYRRDVTLVHTVVYEALVDLHQDLERLRDVAKPKEYRRTLRSVTSVRSLPMRQKQEILTPDAVIMDLQARDKAGVIRELLENLTSRRGAEINNVDAVLDAILEREEVAPTEMEFGVSLPHGRTDEVATVMAAVGICAEGLDIDCLDNTAAKLVILVVSPKTTSGPHLQFLANITGNLRNQEMVDQVVRAESPEEVVRLLIGAHGPGPSLVKRLMSGG